MLDHVKENWERSERTPKTCPKMKHHTRYHNHSCWCSFLLLGFLLPIISWEQSQGCSWTYDNSGISDVFGAFWGHQLKIKSWVTGLFPGLATTTLGISILLHKLLGLFWKSLGPPKSQLSLGEYKSFGATPAGASFCFLDSFVPSSPGSKNSKSWMVGSGILEGYPCWIM